MEILKSFDSDYLNFWPASDNSGTRLIEYIATFPGIEVKPGDTYKACVLVVESANTICKEGANSPGKRPEIVDISLNSDSSTRAVKVATENTTARIDAKKLDTETVDAKKLDTETVDAKKLDTKDTDTKKLNTKDTDTKKLNTQKLNTDGLASKPPFTDEKNIFG